MDINSLLDSLTEEDIEKLKTTAAQFMGGIASEGSEKKETPTGEGFPGISPDMLSAVARVSSAMNQNDVRSDFIKALKPLLSPERGKKADDAVMMLKFLKILETMKGSLL